MASIIRGDDNFDSSAAGGLKFISSTDISSDATAEFTGFNSALYDSYEFVFSNVLPATDGTIFSMRTSSNGGVSYNTGTGDYSRATGFINYAISGQGGGASASYISVSYAGVGNASGEQGVSGVVKVFSPHLIKRTYLMSDVVYVDNGGVYYRTTGLGARLTDAVVNGIRFYYSSGNLASGTITMYGKVNS
tara:strand:- start:285 stop:857 length:573 start_codon:yes stop_codon:yes gene_type:complete